MIIQMVVQMSGSRYDDRMWPQPWVNFEVPDEEGRGLIRAGAAMEVVQQETEQAPHQASQAPQTPQIPPYVASPPPATAQATASPPAPAQDEEPAKPPSPNDPKAAWVEHAMANHGVGEDEANTMTKAQLQANYGGRM